MYDSAGPGLDHEGNENEFSRRTPCGRHLFWNARGQERSSLLYLCNSFFEFFQVASFPVAYPPLAYAMPEIP